MPTSTTDAMREIHDHRVQSQYQINSVLLCGKMVSRAA